MRSPVVTIERIAGSAAEFHARAIPLPGEMPNDEVLVWHADFDAPAIVLGSRQRSDVLDLDACRRAGVEVATRRSGGGVVYLTPDEVVWVDVIVGATDARFTTDLRASMRWLGRCWVDALQSVVAGIDPERLAVHAGGIEAGPWSDLVCFAGIGPGEVLLDGRKLVGISQRRTRDGARFQCAVHRRFDPAVWTPLLAAPLPPLDDLPDVATLPMPDADAVIRALAASIGS